ncbi:MAG: PA2169 family four-helix-bundle protein [Hydrogenophaga sp.]|jgi:uncharacterized protein (TIGR02284 family)|nr:PA2169 family four-helix-bundle protein [Hydrogenophaga sp.]
MEHNDVVKTLNKLIETSKDGEYGFRTSGEHCKSPQIRELFMKRADECRKAAAELQSLVVQHGGSAEDTGSASGAMHRGWVAVKGALAGYTDLAMLEETERGEDVALASYRRALEQDLPPNVRSVVETHLQGVQRNHDQVRMLRDQARAAEA